MQAEATDAEVQQLCAHWWEARDIYADQALFQEGGAHYLSGGYGATRCWLWQITQFLNTEFSHEEDGKPHTFRPRDLSLNLQQRLVGQLGVNIGLFCRDFEKLHKKYLADTQGVTS